MQATTRGEPHRSVPRRRGAAIAMAIAMATMLGAGESLAVPSHGADARLAFPGAVGWAAHTPGGRGGEILRVTTLAGDGPGSFAAAVAAKGPRIVVFEVGGVIDLGVKTVRITEPYLTIAGHTAPAPGITMIRGGIDIATHDVVVRHIRVRPGTAGLEAFSGTEFDAISTRAGRNVIVDHCSLSWATDENLSASGPRFAVGARDTAGYVAGTSHAITFSNNLISEGLSHAGHATGEHSKGSLIHDHVRDILIVGNLYAHNYERNPLFKGGAHGQVINNLVYNPGQRAIHYNLIAEEWIDHPYENGRLVILGNVMRAGPSTESLGLFMIGGSGDIDLYADDNIAVDRIGRPLAERASYTNAPVKVNELEAAPELPFGVQVLPSSRVQDAVVANVGATPWYRDDIDRRILAETIEGRGRIIDNQAEVGGYPAMAATRKDFVPGDWHLDTMEPRKPLERRAPLK